MDPFQIFHALVHVLSHIENMCHHFLLFLIYHGSLCILSNQENLCMIQNDLNLSYFKHNAIHQHDKMTYLIPVKIIVKNFINNFICIITNQNFYVIIFWMDTLFLLLFSEDIEFIFLVRLIFHSADLLISYYLNMV